MRGLNRVQIGVIVALVLVGAVALIAWLGSGRQEVLVSSQDRQASPTATVGKSTNTPQPAPTSPPPSSTAMPQASSIATAAPTATPQALATATPLPLSTAAPFPSPTSKALPLVRGSSRIGLWIGGGDANTVKLAKEAGASWLRITVVWSSIEPTRSQPPTYDFSAYDGLLEAMGKAEINPIVEIRGNPKWAASTACGPIDSPGGLEAFGQFMQALAKRYAKAPYNARHWEFYNESDNTSVEWGDYLGGCWGAYPKEYVAMLKAGHDGIKSVDPDAKLILGGLAHENPPDFFNLNFANQVLAAGAATYLDIMNIHFFSSQNPTWAANGYDIAGKVGALRKTMASHGTSMPVMVTELSWTSSPVGSPEIPERQARYVAKVLARGVAIDLYAMTWFALAEWEGADYPYGLMDTSYRPRPSYQAFQTAAAEFGGARFVRKLAPSDVGASGDIEGYAFDAGGQERWVLWAEGGQQEIKLPARATEARDKLGGTIPLVSGSATNIALGDSPIFVRLKAS